MSAFEAAYAWLTPARRKRIYVALPAVAAVLVALGWFSPSEAEGGATVAVKAVEVAALLLASVKARRVEWTAVYAAGAGLAVALSAVGVEIPSRWLDVAAYAAAAGPLIAAAVRTDPATPTGEPEAEYEARHRNDAADRE